MSGKSRLRQAAEALASPIRSGELEVSNHRYLPGFARRAEDACLLGATNADLADLFEVDPATIGRWISKIAPFGNAIKRGRETALGRVGRSLYHAAVGYEHPETKLNVVGGKLKKTVVSKHYAPNVEAAKLILTNRAAKHWKDSKTVTHSGQIDLMAAIEEGLGAKAKPIAVTVLDQSEEPEGEE